MDSSQAGDISLLAYMSAIKQYRDAIFLFAEEIVMQLINISVVLNTQNILIFQFSKDSQTPHSLIMVSSNIFRS